MHVGKSMLQVTKQKQSTEATQNLHQILMQMSKALKSMLASPRDPHPLSYQRGRDSPRATFLLRICGCVLALTILVGGVAVAGWWEAKEACETIALHRAAQSYTAHDTFAFRGSPRWLPRVSECKLGGAFWTSSLQAFRALVR